MRLRRTTGGLAVLLLAACGQGTVDDDVAAEPPAEEVVCFSGSYEPAEEGELVPREQACPEESPSPSGSPSAASWDVGTAFLPPEAAAAADPGDWAVLRDAEPEPGPLFDPCGEKAFPRAADIAASAERSIGWQEEASGSDVVQEVFQYSSAEVAAQAFAEYAAAVERCPRVDSEAEGFFVKHAVVRQDESDGVQRLLVRRQPCQEPDMCTAHFASYYLVAQAEDGLTSAHYGIYSDGDPAEQAPVFLAAVADQLAKAVAEP